MLGETSTGLGHGADYASDDFQVSQARRLRLAVFSGAGQVEIATPVRQALVAPDPGVAIG